MASGSRAMESGSTGDAKKDEEWERSFLKYEQRLADLCKVRITIECGDGKKFEVPKVCIEFSNVLEDMVQAAEVKAKKNKTKEVTVLVPFSSESFTYILQWMKEAVKLNVIAPDYEWEKKFVRKIPIPILHEMVMAAEFLDNDRMMDAFYTGLYACGCSCMTGGQGQGQAKGQRQAQGRRRPSAQSQKSCGYFQQGGTSKSKK